MRRIRFALFAAIIAGLLGSGAAEMESGAERVFLMHGLGRSSASMLLLKHRLEGRGFEVISKSYDSTEGRIGDHVDWLAEELEAITDSEESPLHFVTHSLGGIVLRVYLSEHALPNLGRVVMLTPPSQGSELADYLKDWKVYQLATGPSGQQIGTDEGSVPLSLGPVDFELGVIAGDRSINPITSRIIPGPDDGKVSVENAKVEGMSDFIVLRHSHTFIMNSRDTADQVAAFLRDGAFRHPTDPIEEKLHEDQTQ